MTSIDYAAELERELAELDERRRAAAVSRASHRTGVRGSPDATVPELVDRLTRDLGALRRVLGDGSGS